MLFSGLVYYLAGPTKFFEFQSAYWIEKALSVDNLFVFILVFKFFNVANQNKHKVLFWGIIGALFLRAIFIFSGAFLIELTYLNKLLSLVGIQGFIYDVNIIMTAFGLFLVYAGIKSWSAREKMMIKIIMTPEVPIN
jgi:tellurite resistance protein TerC